MIPSTWMALGAIAGELMGGVLFRSEAMRAATSVGLFGMAGSVALLSRGSGRTARPSGRYSLFLAALLAVGTFGLGVALVRANPLYYVAADTFHLFFEIGAMSLVGWTIMQRDPGEARLLVLRASGLVCIVGTVSWMLGTFGFHVQDGNVVPGLGVWRLDLGKGAPHVPLVMMWAVALDGSNRRSRRILMHWVVLVLLLVLVGTLKRSLWLAAGVCIPLVIAGYKLPRMGAIAGATASVIAPFLVVALLTTSLGQESSTALDLLTYNRAYSTDESLLERQLQISDAMSLISRNPGGEGLGAVVRVYDPEVGTTDDTHYVHNWYVFEVLQCGFLFGSMAIAALAGVAVYLWRRSRGSLQARWAVVGPAASITMLLITGSVMLSMHTVWTGLLVGYGLAAARR